MAAAAAEALSRQRFVTLIDVCVGLGWVHERNVAAWRQGRIGCLADITQAGPAKRASAFDALDRWARANGLDAGDERQGVLVGEAGLAQAEQECLADEDARMRPAIDRILTAWS